MSKLFMATRGSLLLFTGLCLINGKAFSDLGASEHSVIQTTPSNEMRGTETDTFVTLLQKREALILRLDERQDLTVPQRIDERKAVVSIDLEILRKLKLQEPDFLEDSGWEAEQAGNAIRKALVSDRYNLSVALQKSRAFEESIPILEQVVNESGVVLSDQPWLTREYQLKLDTAKKLATATPEVITQWESCEASHRRANAAFAKGEFMEAADLYVEIANALEAMEMKQTMSYGQAVANLAEALARLADTEKAIAAFDHAIEVNDELFQKQAITNASMRVSFGKFLRGAQQTEMALLQLTDAANIFDHLPVPEDDQIRIYTELLRGICLVDLGRYVEASKTLTESQRMIRLTNLSNDFFAEAPSSNLYRAYLKLNDIEDDSESLSAEDVGERASLQASILANKIFDKEHEAAAFWLMAIAKEKGKLNQSQAALAFLVEAEKRFELLGDKQQSAGFQDCISMIANNRFTAADYAEAVRYAKQTVELERQVSGSDSLDYMIKLQNLAVFYTCNGQYEDAEKVFGTVIPFLTSKLGSENIDYLRTLQDQARNFLKSQQWDRAIESLEALLVLHENRSTPAKADYLLTLENLKLANQEKGNLQAVRLLEERIESLRDELNLR